MTAEEKKMTMSQNLSAALNPVKIGNPANVDPVTRQEVQKKSLSELKVEIKFHLGQMAGHAVEIGKCLIEAKEQVGHGEWAKWLEENFKLKRQSAQNFMSIAERFGSNYQTFGNLGYSQMLNLLALPAGEEEKFIEAKAAEGTPVEDMTVKNLKAEIADWKAKIAQAEQERDEYKAANELADAQMENLSQENMKLVDAQKADQERYSQIMADYANMQEQIEELQDKYDESQNELLREKNNVKTTTVEVAPADYEPMKKELSEIKTEYEKLQAELKELQNRPLEVAVEKPADYEATKAKLAELEERQKTLKSYYEAGNFYRQSYEALRHLDSYVSLQDFFKKSTADTPNMLAEIRQFRRFLVHLTVKIDKFLSAEDEPSDHARVKRVDIPKIEYKTMQDWLEKISNGQREFVPLVQAKAEKYFRKQIPESVFNADDSRKAFAVWLGREINPIVVDGDYKEEIRVIGDSYDWSAVKQ